MSSCPVRLSFKDPLPDSYYDYEETSLVSWLVDGLPRFFFGNNEDITLMDFIQQGDDDNSNNNEYIWNVLSLWIVVSVILVLWIVAMMICHYRYPKSLLSGQRPQIAPPPLMVAPAKTVPSPSMTTQGTSRSTSIVTSPIANAAANKEETKQHEAVVVESVEVLQQLQQRQQQKMHQEVDPHQDRQIIIETMPPMDDDDSDDDGDGDDESDLDGHHHRDQKEAVQEQQQQEEDYIASTSLLNTSSTSSKSLTNTSLLLNQSVEPADEDDDRNRAFFQDDDDEEEETQRSPPPPPSPPVSPSSSQKLLSPKVEQQMHPLVQSSPYMMNATTADDDGNDDDSDDFTNSCKSTGNNDSTILTATIYCDTTTNNNNQKDNKSQNDDSVSMTSLTINSITFNSESKNANNNNDDEDDDEDDQTASRNTSAKYDEYRRYLEEAASNRSLMDGDSHLLDISQTTGALSSSKASTDDSDDWLLNACLSDEYNYYLDGTIPPPPNSVTTITDESTTLLDSLDTTQSSFPETAPILGEIGNGGGVLGRINTDGGDDDDDDGMGFLLFQDTSLDDSAEHYYSHQQDSLLGGPSSNNNNKSNKISTSNYNNKENNNNNASQLAATSLPYSNFSSQAASRKRILENYVEAFKSSSSLSFDQQSVVSCSASTSMHSTTYTQQTQQQSIINVGMASSVINDTTMTDTLAKENPLQQRQEQQSYSSFHSENASAKLDRQLQVLPNDDDHDHDDDDYDMNNTTTTTTYNYNHNDDLSVPSANDTFPYNFDLSEDLGEEKKDDDNNEMMMMNSMMSKDNNTTGSRGFPSSSDQRPLHKSGNDSGDDDNNSFHRHHLSSSSPRSNNNNHHHTDDNNIRNNTPSPTIDGSIPSNNTTTVSKQKKYQSQEDLATAWQVWSKQESRYECQIQLYRIVVVLATTLLIVASLILTLNGINYLEDQTQVVLNIWDGIRETSDQLDGFLQTLRGLQNSVLQQTWNIWQLLDQNCPYVRQSVCSLNTECNVTGLPLEDIWEEWLVFVQPSNVANLYQGENWTALQFDLERLEDQQEDLESSGMYFKWALWTACACNSFLALLAFAIMVGTSFDIKFLATRWFAMLFWWFVFLAWAFSTVFWVGTVVTADACGGSGIEGSTNSIDSPSALASTLLETHIQPESFLGDYWKYHIDGCSAEEYPPYVNDRVWVWANLLPPTQRLVNGLEGMDPAEYEHTCGTSLDPLTSAATVLNLQLCMVTQALANVRRILACDQWYPFYQSLVYETVCYQGSQGLIWGTSAQATILLSAFLIWTLRAAFLPMKEIDDEVEDTDKKKANDNTNKGGTGQKGEQSSYTHPESSNNQNESSPQNSETRITLV